MKIVLIISLVFFYAVSFCQQTTPMQYVMMGQVTSAPPTPTGSNFRGVWGIGENPQSNFTANAHQGTEAAWKGYQYNPPWKSIQPTSKNSFDWTAFDNDIQFILSKGIYAVIDVQYSPGGPNKNTPDWMWPISDSFTTHGGNLDGPYPKYYASGYQTYFFNFLQALAAHVTGMGDSVVVGWQSSEGSTGDTGPFKGTLDAQYNGDPDVPQSDGTQWQNFRKRVWDSIYLYLQQNNNTWTNMIINTGNDHEWNEYVLSNFGQGTWVKEGRLSHDYVFDGEGIYPLLPDQLSRGEVQGNIFSSAHPKKDAWAMVVSCTGLGLGIFNTPGGWYQNVIGTSDLRYNAFFNRYSNDTNVVASKRGFISMGLQIGIDSLTRWTEAQYGLLISPTPPKSHAQYSADSAAISNDPSFGASNKLFRIMQLLTTGAGTYTRPQRITSLSTTNPTNAIIDLSASQNWDNDYVWSQRGNLGHWITQTNSIATARPIYRLGSDTTPYGRFAEQFIITGGTAPDMTFDIDNTWNHGSVLSNVTFTIYYLNDGTGTWTFKADTGSGFVDIFSQTNTNTDKWILKTVTVNNMKLGTATDFKLHYVNGSNTPFTMIEISTP